MRTHGHGGEHYTLGSIGGNKGGTARGGELGRDSMRRNARCDFGHAGVRIAVLRRGFSRKARSIRQDDFERGSFLVHNVGR